MNFDYINGSCLLIKRRVLEKIGLLDEQFFLYFEETDLALRASKNHYKRIFVPNSKIWHKVSKSGGGIKQEIGLYYITRNRWIFMKKWANKTNFIIFVVIQILGVIILPILLSIYYNNRKLFSAYYGGFWNGLKEKNID
jgi:GT2 family glycosyltransferase